MIKSQQNILINENPKKVFRFIETMPNKFPVYKILETKPIFFIRILLVDGLRSAFKWSKNKKPEEQLKLQLGDRLGPFQLMEVEEPNKYIFLLNAFFFKCKTGYTLFAKDDKTILNFVLLANKPSVLQNIWWFFTKYIHVFLAKKVLTVIKNKIEKD